MLIIPAIDLKGGKCVRLYQGRREEETVFSGSPRDTAKRFADEGAERLHVIDLDAAFGEKRDNLKGLEAIAGAVQLPIEFGGGLRDEASLRRVLDSGASFLILGTAAYREPEFARSAFRQYPGKIILGVDVRGGKVAVSGWEEETEMLPETLALRFAAEKPAAVIFTDIERDGAMTGPNVAATRNLARAVETPVIASGGVASLKDIKALLPLEAVGVMGVVLGRALYEGKIMLPKAIEYAGQTHHPVP